MYTLGVTALIWSILNNSQDYISSRELEINLMSLHTLADVEQIICIAI